MKNTHGGVTLLKVTLIHGCFFTFYKLFKWYQIAQCITYNDQETVQIQTNLAESH